MVKVNNWNYYVVPGAVYRLDKARSICERLAYYDVNGLIWKPAEVGFTEIKHIITENGKKITIEDALLAIFLKSRSKLK